MRKLDSFPDLKLLTHSLRSQNSKEFDGYYASETQTLRVLIKIKQRMAKGLAREHHIDDKLRFFMLNLRTQWLL